MKTRKRRHVASLVAPLLGLLAILALATGPALARTWAGLGTVQQGLVSGELAATVAIAEDADEGLADEDVETDENTQVDEDPGDQGADEDPGDQGADEDQGDQGADENDDSGGDD